MRVGIVTWSGHEWALDKLRGVDAFHRNRGDSVEYRTLSENGLARILSKKDVVYIWNGAYPCIRDSVPRELEDAGVRVIYVEIGWFPQDEFLYFDPRGTNAYSDLMRSPLDWLEPGDFLRLDEMSESYREGRPLEKKGYVFAPLQLSVDTQVALWSPFKYMGDFIRHTRWVFRDKKVIFRRHPKDEKTYADLGIGREGEGDLKDLICGADLVYGINSTVLLEAALMGKDVVATGTSFLNMGPSRRHALAALVARQVPSGEADLTPWIRPGRGLEHLIPYVS